MKISIWTVGLCALLVAGCKKEPGEGGKAEIRGHVFVTEMSLNTGNPTGLTWYGPDQRVYIVYGDGDYYDDNVDTGPDGLFVFRWMRKGSYTVFVYSECPTCESGVSVVSKTMEITENKQVLDMGTFNIEDWCNGC